MICTLYSSGTQFLNILPCVAFKSYVHMYINTQFLLVSNIWGRPSNFGNGSSPYTIGIATALWEVIWSSFSCCRVFVHINPSIQQRKLNWTTLTAILRVEWFRNVHKELVYFHEEHLIFTRSRWTRTIILFNFKNWVLKLKKYQIFRENTVNAYIRTCVYMYVCVHMYVCTYIHKCVCMYVYTCYSGN